MECVRLSACPFYNDKLPINSGLGAIFKKKYCMDRSNACARFVVSQQLGPAAVPDTLYPGMLDVAYQILREASKTPANE
ncbi:hypothetical protein AAFA46_00135 [Oscillospiraceae bacterium WX1]